MRFPSLSMQESPLKVDVFKPIGTAYLVLKPDTNQYKVIFSESEDMSAEIEIGSTDSNAPSQQVQVSPRNTKDAQEYLERHQVLSFVQAMLQTVVKEKPDKPYEVMAR